MTQTRALSNAVPFRIGETFIRKCGGPHYRRLRSVFALLLVVAAGAGCSTAPPDMSSLLEPDPDARVWPLAPNTPRYVYVGQLIGERDFKRGDDTRGAIVTTLKWIAGLVVGEPDYLELQRPVSGMTGADGRIYVADMGLQAVVVFDLAQAKVMKWQRAAPGVRFVSPVAIAGDGNGGILVTDSELGAVFHLDAEGDPVQRLGEGILTRPTGIARDDRTGNIYVADTRAHDIKVFDDHGSLVELIGSRGDGRGTFNAPTHLAVSDSELYVADTLNFRVHVFDTVGDDRLTFGRLGLYVGNMTRPKGVAVGGDGRIYVVESYFDHLLVYDRNGQLLLPIGGTGRGVGQFYLPSGVWTDTSGRVYVADMFNGRIEIFKELPGEPMP